MKKNVSIALLALCLPALALAATRDGVTMPDTQTVAGKTLQLNGMGLRTKLFFKVYVAGLYLENKTQDTQQIINGDQVRSVRMVMLRDLTKDQIAEAIREGFQKNSGDKLPALKDRLDKFIAQIPDVKKGEVLELTYVPGTGTTAKTKSGDATSVQGKDFADALFAVWLGRSPVDEELKKGMLGK